MSGELAGRSEAFPLPVPRRRLLQRRHRGRRAAATAALRTRMAGERRSASRAPAAAPDGQAGMSRLREGGKLPGQIATWLGERFELEDSVMAVLRHPVPRELERPVGWWYVLGSATLAIFVMQVVTGVGLAMTYVPAPNSAYDSLQFISHDATLGAVVRGMHYFGAGAMVILVLAHMTQVYLFGAFKFPREANWLTGSLLLLATLAMAFTGQLLRWDQDAFWAVVVAAARSGPTPRGATHSLRPSSSSRSCCSRRSSARRASASPRTPPMSWLTRGPIGTSSVTSRSWRSSLRRRRRS